jgi:hypothetical protein
MQVEEAASDGRFFFGKQTADSKRWSAKYLRSLDMNNFRLFAVCCFLFTT